MTRTHELHLTIRCKLDDQYFLDNWDDLTPEIQKFWETNRSEPYCEGSGAMGTWCHGCNFCEIFEEEEV